MWKLQGGSYIPGVSGIGHQVGLSRDVYGSRKGMDDFSEKVGKYGGRLGMAGKLGKFLGGKALKKYGGKKIAGMLAKTAFGSTPLGMLAGIAAPMVLERLGKHGGGELMKGLAKKIGFAKKPTSPKGEEFGLHQDKYKELGKLPGQIESELTGASAGEALGGLSLNEMWRNLPGGKESAAGVLGGAKTQAKNLLFNRDDLPGAEQIMDLEGTGFGSEWGGSHLGDKIGQSAGISNIGAGFGLQQPNQFGLDSGLDFASNLTSDASYTGDIYGGIGPRQTQQGGYMQGYQEGGEAEDKSTFGQRFVKRFPSQHEDPERAAGQERGLTSLIDFLIPQSKLDVALSALPIGALGKVGRKALGKSGRKIMKKIDPEDLYEHQISPQDPISVKQTSRGDIPDPEFGGWMEPEYDVWAREGLDPSKKFGLSEMYDEEGRIIDLVDAIKRQGMQMGGMMPGGVSNALPYQQGGSISPYNLGGSVTQQPMAYQLGGLLKYKRSPMMG